jgi:mRNA-degrading endonuclease RelE of RelBE toxin-antitoxin system
LAYEVVVAKSAERALRSLSSESRRRIAPLLQALADVPHPQQSIRLRGSNNLRWRIGTIESFIR